MEYTFNVYNALAKDGIFMALDKLLSAYRIKKTVAGKGFLETNTLPVIVCIGSDLAVGDSLGPIAGTLIKHKTQGLHTYIYGTLSSPVTAKEISYVRKFLKETHKNAPVLAIDAAVGESGDVGLIKLTDSPLKPGAGANKKLGAIGDISILGIVAEKSLLSYGIFNTTRLALVYAMAEKISEAVGDLFWSLSEKDEKRLTL